MPAQHVGLEAAVVVPHFLHGQPSGFQQPLQLAQLPALPADLGHVDLAHHLARVGQDIAPVQEGHTLGQRVQVRFLVQLQAQAGQVFADDGQALLQIRLVRVDQYKIVHVPDILADMQPLFDQVIQIIQHRQGHKLAHFAAQADAAPVVAKTVYDLTDAPHRLPVFDALGDGGLGHIMRDAVKIVVNITLQRPAVRPEGQGRVPGFGPLLPVISFQVAGQAVQGVVHAAPA